MNACISHVSVFDATSLKLRWISNATFCDCALNLYERRASQRVHRSQRRSALFGGAGGDGSDDGGCFGCCFCCGGDARDRTYAHIYTYVRSASSAACAPSPLQCHVVIQFSVNPRICTHIANTCAHAHICICVEIYSVYMLFARVCVFNLTCYGRAFFSLA